MARRFRFTTNRTGGINGCTDLNGNSVSPSNCCTENYATTTDSQVLNYCNHVSNFIGTRGPGSGNGNQLKKTELSSGQYNLTGFGRRPKLKMGTLAPKVNLQSMGLTRNEKNNNRFSKSDCGCNHF